jgi:hypothetical protein
MSTKKGRVSYQQTQRGEPVNRQEFNSTLGQRLPLRFLVAEDEPVNQQMMRLMLGPMAYPADFADDGLEALGAQRLPKWQAPSKTGRIVKRDAHALYLAARDPPEIGGLGWCWGLAGHGPILSQRRAGRAVSGPPIGARASVTVTPALPAT